MPDPAGFERHEFAAIGVALRVRRGVAVDNPDGGERGGVIRLSYPAAFDDGSAYDLLITPVSAYRLADETAAAHKRWLFEDSDRQDVVLRLDASDALIYDATEPGLERTCAMWAVRELGGKRWLAQVEERSAVAGVSGLQRKWRLPAGTCADLVVTVRSLEAL